MDATRFLVGFLDFACCESLLGRHRWFRENAWKKPNRAKWLVTTPQNVAGWPMPSSIAWQPDSGQSGGEPPSEFDNPIQCSAAKLCLIPRSPLTRRAVSQFARGTRPRTVGFVRAIRWCRRSIEALSLKLDDLSVLHISLQIYANCKPITKSYLSYRRSYPISAYIPFDLF